MVVSDMTRREALAAGAAAAVLAGIGISPAYAEPLPHDASADRELRLSVSDGFTRQTWIYGGQVWGGEGLVLRGAEVAGRDGLHRRCREDARLDRGRFEDDQVGVALVAAELLGQRGNARGGAFEKLEEGAFVEEEKAGDACRRVG